MSAFAIYGRWWQLERWLRDVVRIELAAKYGPKWADTLPSKIAKYADRSSVNRYMASADEAELLAFADVSDLVALIDQDWDLFEPVLMPKVRWQALVDVLPQIRHRNAHCRRPHRDDLARLEQALRDLEHGAAAFLDSFEGVPLFRSEPTVDPVIEAWLGKKHLTASRLVDHAHNQYHTTFELKVIARPWAPRLSPSETISGSPGYLFRAEWWWSGRLVEPKDLWARIRQHACVRDNLLQLLMPTTGDASAVFSALSDPDAISDAIGYIFDAVLDGRRNYEEPEWEDWKARETDLPRDVRLTFPLATGRNEGPVFYA